MNAIPEHRLPEHRRKNIHKGPPQYCHDANEWVLGHARVLKLLASSERAGHTAVVARLNKILREVMLTTEQAQEVRREIFARKVLIEDCNRIIANNQGRIDYQLKKDSRFRVVDPKERDVWMIKSDYTPVIAQKLDERAGPKGLLRDRRPRDITSKQPKYDTTTLSSFIK